MGRLKWYKRDPEAALVGMRVLTCEERGAYNTVLDLIYAHDGRLVDDDRYLAGECALSMRSWRRIKARLMELGKIRSVDGIIHNGRADKEVEFGLKKVETAKVAGEISAQKRKASINENNDLASTTVGTVAPTESRSKKKTSEDANASSGASSAPGLFDSGPVPDKVYADPKDELWGEGVPALMMLGGVSEGTVRSVIGKWMKETGNDARAILAAIRRAQEQRPVGSIVAWVTRAIEMERKNGSSQGIAARAAGQKQTNADAVLAAARVRAASVAERIEREREVGESPADQFAP